MKNPISKQVFNHLEYLGYVVEDVTEDNEIDTLLATSKTRYNLLVNVLKDNSIYVSTKILISESSLVKNTTFLEAINRENSRFMFTKIYYEEDSEKKTILAISTSTLNYDKPQFVMMTDFLERNTREYLDGLKEFYSNEQKVSYGQAIVDELMDTTKDKENISNRMGF